MVRQSTHMNKTICTEWIFNILKYLKCNNLSATNGTFVTKGEIESNFLTTPTEEPKFNNWVNTTLNQLVLQFKPSSRCTYNAM